MIVDTNACWDAMHVRLQEYKRRSGHCCVSYGEDFALSKWCWEQRIRKKMLVLSKRCQRRLDDIDFVWNPNAHKLETYLTQILEQVGQVHPPEGCNDTVRSLLLSQKKIFLKMVLSELEPTNYVSKVTNFNITEILEELPSQHESDQDNIELPFLAQPATAIATGPSPVLSNIQGAPTNFETKHPRTSTSGATTMRQTKDKENHNHKAREQLFERSQRTTVQPKVSTAAYLSPQHAPPPRFNLSHQPQRHPTLLPKQRSTATVSR